ncbi:Dihydrofolate reductase [Candidatus Hartigia pinicola]|nr:Dihydrofolate reductase [Candidatus Hartigia pinicola]
MNISLIAAMTADQVIGINKTIPWNLPRDLAWFKHNTLNKPIIMGRLTYESIGYPLPSRVNIVLSNKTSSDKNVIWTASIAESLVKANNTQARKNKKEIIVIGGEKIYQQFLPLANKLYLTHINAKIMGNIYFPIYNTNEWECIFNEYHKKDKHHFYSYSFKILTKKT